MIIAVAAGAQANDNDPSSESTRTDVPSRTVRQIDPDPALKQSCPLPNREQEREIAGFFGIRRVLADRPL